MSFSDSWVVELEFVSAEADSPETLESSMELDWLSSEAVDSDEEGVWDNKAYAATPVANTIITDNVMMRLFLMFFFCTRIIFVSFDFNDTIYPY